MSEWLSLKVSKNPQFRISVPKKVVPLATRRNRIKRLIREALRLNNFFFDSAAKPIIKVQSFPEHLNLKQVEQALKRAIATST